MKKAAVALALIALAAAPAAAQGRGHKSQKKVPPGHLPPPGQCRVWYDGVSPGHQPPPTSCAEAERAAARDGRARVVYGNGNGSRSGDVWRQGGGGDDGRIIGRESDGRRRDGRRDDEEARRREGSRDRGNKPAIGRAIPRGGGSGTSREGGARDSDSERRPSGADPRRIPRILWDLWDR